MTGLARSGTTLCCHLLNKLPNFVALLEPMNPENLAGIGDARYLSKVDQFFADQRSSLWRNHTAVSKAGRDGVIPDNSFGFLRNAMNRRLCLASTQRVSFKPVTDPNFRLAIKHPSMFTAKLGLLATRYPCFALIRNPLALLLSWSSVEAHIADGHVPMAEIFDEGLRSVLASEPDRVGRQLLILSHFCKIYCDNLLPGHVLKYEDMVATGGRALSVIDPNALEMNESFEERNVNSLYHRDSVKPLAQRLLGDHGAWRVFYTDADIVDLERRWESAKN